jgi:hypothetical protein
VDERFGGDEFGAESGADLEGSDGLAGFERFDARHLCGVDRGFRRGGARGHEQKRETS